MRIRIQWKIECLSHVGLKYKYLLSLVDPHPDSTYHPDADPDAYADSDFYFAADPEPFFMRMRIRIRLFTLMPIWIRILAST
jgi:hypothetical protein